MAKNDSSAPLKTAEGAYPALPEPDTHCHDEDTGRDVWSYSAEQMRAYAAQAVAAQAARAAIDRPQVPRHIGRLIDAYGASRADEDGQSGTRIGELVSALRDWAASIATPEQPATEDSSAGDLAEHSSGPALDGGTPGPWRIRKRERDGELLDCFVEAPDCQGLPYAAEIMGDDEYREDLARKLADCELIVKAVNALRAGTAQAEVQAQPVEWPATCDGHEQEAWEAWAKSERHDMSEHPLHYLFLNERTNAARQGWKAGLVYAVAQMQQRPLPAPQAQPADALPQRTEAEIVKQTEELAKYLLRWKWGLEPESPEAELRNSGNLKAQVCWNAACEIQELITDTDVENAVSELDAAMAAAQEGGKA